MRRALLLASLVAASAALDRTLHAAPAPSGSASSAPTTAPATPDAEPVSLKTADRLQLAATFFPARSKKADRAPAALLVHDAGGTRADVEKLAESLQRRGFAVLTLDLRGHGESKTAQVAWTPDDEPSCERLWAFAMRDLDAAASYLRGRSDVHASNLSLVGVGAGAAIAARHAVNDANARAVVLITPRETCLGFNLVGDLKELGGLPTLIVAEKDRRQEADRLAEASNSSEGIHYVDVAVMKSNGAEVLEDRRLPGEIARYLLETVAPSR